MSSKVENNGRRNKSRGLPVVETLDGRVLYSASIVGSGYTFQAFEHTKIGDGTPDGGPILASFAVSGLPTGNLNAYSAEIFWHDHTSQKGLIYSTNIADQPTLGVDIATSKTMPGVGTLSFTVYFSYTASRTHLTAKASGTGTIIDIPINATGTTVYGSDSGVMTNVTVANFVLGANFLSAPTSDFAATVKWGDGKSSVGQINYLGNGKFSVTANHAYGFSILSRTYALTVTITGISTPTTTVDSGASLLGEIVILPKAHQGIFADGL